MSCSIQIANEAFDEGKYEDAYQAYEALWTRDGNVEALIQTCWMLFAGIGVEKNSGLALENLKGESLENCEVSFAIARMLHLQLSYEDATKWFEKAKSEGSIRALLYLGFLSEINKNYKRAAEYYSQGIGEGSVSCEYQLVKLKIKVEKSFSLRARYEVKKIKVLVKILLKFMKDISDEGLYDIYSDKKILRASKLLNRRHP